MKQITLTKYKQILTSFFNQHLQINTVLFGDTSDLNGNENIIYPVANIEFLDSGINNNLQIDRFEITIADLQNDEDTDHYFTIINDATMIAQDLLNYINGDDFAFQFQISNVTQIQNFTNKFDDITSGVNFAINLSQQRLINPCNLPLAL